MAITGRGLGTYREFEEKQRVNPKAGPGSTSYWDSVVGEIVEAKTLNWYGTRRHKEGNKLPLAHDRRTAKP
jgi:hypothetical protein